MHEPVEEGRGKVPVLREEVGVRTMSDGNKLKEVMCDGEWWSLRDLSRAIKKSKEETKARIVDLVKSGELKVQGRTKDRVYRLQKAVREETIVMEGAKAQVPVVTGALKRAAPKKASKVKPKARPAPPSPVHEHDWRGSKDGYRRCETCGIEEYKVKGEWVPVPEHAQTLAKDEVCKCGHPLSSHGPHGCLAAHPNPKPGEVYCPCKRANPLMATTPEADDGKYCASCGIEIVPRGVCEECAKIPKDKIVMLCPGCSKPAVIEWKKGANAVELTGRCDHCGLFQTALELPPLTPPPR
jgi:hypothetical protein